MYANCFTKARGRGLDFVSHRGEHEIAAENNVRCTPGTRNFLKFRLEVETFSLALVFNSLLNRRSDVDGSTLVDKMI